jgi:DNA-directed RNA polymerase subunit RPC12/RpoP
MPETPTTRGTLTKTPCPHCGKSNNLKSVAELELLEVGTKLECDHCQRLFKIIHVQPTVLLTVRAL